MVLIGRKALGPSVSMEVSRDTKIQPDVGADLESLLTAQGYWATTSIDLREYVLRALRIHAQTALLCRRSRRCEYWASSVVTHVSKRTTAWMSKFFVPRRLINHDLVRPHRKAGERPNRSW